VVDKKEPKGGVKRSMIKAYKIQKESNPGISDVEIFKAITRWLYETTGKVLDPVMVAMASQSENLREYLRFIVIRERIPDSLCPEDIIQEIIDEISDEKEAN
jgi:hydroxymethylpyrimidine/phosphomethylpyrimidine kinase